VEEALEATDLASVVEQSLQLVGPQQRLQGVTVERRDLARLPPAAANPQRMIQVLVNLLLNAADAMGGQGTIVVSGTRPDDERVELRVQNSGPPIPAEDRARIFEPFFSTKEPGSGTGLGLCVAQAIAESFDGSLWLADDKQTTFVVALPVWSEES
jgi:signal transduction histidine kinase